MIFSIGFYSKLFHVVFFRPNSLFESPENYTCWFTIIVISHCSRITSVILIRSSCCLAEPLRPKLEEAKTNTRCNALIIVAVVVGFLAAFISILLHRVWIGSWSVLLHWINVTFRVANKILNEFKMPDNFGNADIIRKFLSAEMNGWSWILGFRKSFLFSIRNWLDRLKLSFSLMRTNKLEEA